VTARATLEKAQAPASVVGALHFGSLAGAIRVRLEIVLVEGAWPCPFVQRWPAQVRFHLGQRHAHLNLRRIPPHDRRSRPD
jgi:hypothetical protein